MAKIDTSDFKKGVAIIYKGDPHIIVDCQHHKPGKGNTVMRTKLRNVITGSTIDNNFLSGEQFEAAELQRRKGSYTYSDEQNIYFLDSESYEQVSVDKSMGEGIDQYLKDGLEVDLLMHEGRAINFDIPRKIEYKVIEAPAGVKGDSATGATKSVTLENGLKINVPLFIKEGESIRVNTESGEYVERAN